MKNSRISRAVLPDGHLDKIFFHGQNKKISRKLSKCKIIC